MKHIMLFATLVAGSVCCIAQNAPAILARDFAIEKINEATPVKNQAMTGTCWSFSTTALVESQLIKNNIGRFDLSEMFTVRNIYIEKAKNYLGLQGAAQFGEGSLGHDVIRAIAKYGAVPETVYSGLIAGKTSHDHSALARELKTYLDGLLQNRPLPVDWLAGFEAILDKQLGKPPANFAYKDKNYTAVSFAKEILHFKAGDYINLTSFTQYPSYEPVVLNIPDNFSNGEYYNLPFEELMRVVKSALAKGYTMMWDADVSNNGFRQDRGLALYVNPDENDIAFNLSAPEKSWDVATRERLFENLTTQDDHLMQLTGLMKTKDGKTFFTVKNSWGDVGPYNGYIAVSEAYFGINTISLVVPKAALDEIILSKLKTVAP